MLKYNANLVLEGGGMRGAYTAGVLDFFHDKEINFQLVTSTSSSALIGSSYVASQRGRNYRILQEIGNNKQSISIRNLIQHKELFSMDFIFDKLSNESASLDFTAFSNSSTKFIIGTTDLDTGKPIYHSHYKSKSDLLTLIRASCSLPILAPSITYEGTEIMDGGISEAIPISPSIESGSQKHVIVLTRNEGYIKKPTRLTWLFKKVFKDYPNFVRLLQTRHQLYNKTTEILAGMEQRGEAFIIRPTKPLQASRVEKNSKKLHGLYIQGYKQAENSFGDLQRFLENSNQSYYFQENISS
ncbi:patatin family protein [Ornithinibacillus salinisoli]|uniref:Patatin family protein n=1 Tax=Ornithinibacillus salinisoli TaxID=1848459 RepID=A0ABW4VUS4_9BACI